MTWVFSYEGNVRKDETYFNSGVLRSCRIRTYDSQGNLIEDNMNDNMSPLDNSTIQYVYYD